MQTRAHSGFDQFLRQLRASARVQFARLRAARESRAADARLFSATFAAGFVFTMMFIG